MSRSTDETSRTSTVSDILVVHLLGYTAIAATLATATWATPFSWLIVGPLVVVTAWVAVQYGSSLLIDHATTRISNDANAEAD